MHKLGFLFKKLKSLSKSNFNYFSNACITYNIILIIHVIVIYTKISLLKLKILKSYLCSMILQSRLNNFVLMSIKNDFLKEY